MEKLYGYDNKFTQIIPSMLYTRYGFVMVRYTPVAGLNQKWSEISESNWYLLVGSQS